MVWTDAGIGPETVPIRVPSRRRPRWLLVPAALGVLAALPPLGLTVSRLLAGRAFFPLTQLAAFTSWAVLGYALSALLLLLGRRWWAAGLVVLLLALHVWWLIPPQHADALSAAAARNDTPVRILSVNAHLGTADPATIVDLARRESADLVAVEELTPELAARIQAGLKAQLPHADLDPLEGGPAGTGIWSRWPMRSLGLLPGTGFAMPRAVVSPPGGGRFTVTAVHTRSPRRLQENLWSADLAAVAEAVGRTSGPQVVLGDFNASRDYPGFRDVLATGLEDSADAVLPLYRPGFTWPSNSPVPPATRLDHVLVTPAAFRPETVSTQWVPATDHRALLVRVVFARR